STSAPASCHVRTCSEAFVPLLSRRLPVASGVNQNGWTTSMTSRFSSIEVAPPGCSEDGYQTATHQEPWAEARPASRTDITAINARPLRTHAERVVRCPHFTRSEEHTSELQSR